METSARSGVRADVWRRYADFLSSPPHTVVEWHDAESTARGWLVVNSWRGGAAGGGTRMRSGCTRDEVVFLAKAMELKFSISGPAIGGAKAGIDFDPEEPHKREVLRRWFQAILPYLETRYSTAGDLNVDEVREVIPLCNELGVMHPQQGMARGHLGLRGEDMRRRLHAVGEGLGQVVSKELGFPDTRQRLADLVTGFGVAVSASRLLERQGASLEGARVLVEGFGRVGGAAALYLTRWGARVVGIIDIHNALVSQDGLGADEVEDLLRQRTTNRLPLGGSAEGAGTSREQFHSVPADICVCAASSGTVDGPAMDRLADQGVRAIISGANRPFASSFPGDTSIDREADDRFAVAADIIANCGTAHAFAYQIELDEPATPAEVFDSVEVTISGALDEAIARAGSTERGLLGAALECTLQRTVTVEEA
jgi:glutamate dehydrogenase (NAD(P)+)